MKAISIFWSHVFLALVSWVCVGCVHTGQSATKDAAHLGQVQGGKVHIGLTSDGQLVAIVEGIEAYDSTLFVLQIENQVEGEFPLSIDQASVWYSAEGNCFGVRSAGSLAISFVLEGTTGCVAGERQYEVYGISRVRNSEDYQQYLSAWRGGGTLPPVSEVSCKCYTYSPSVGYECDHGGAGALECSVWSKVEVFGVSIERSCTAKCKEGYLACCNE